MQLAGKVFVHQVHPAKIGADVTASMISNVLLWKARPKAAVAARVCGRWPAQPPCSARLTLTRSREPGGDGTC